jgi:hypothetical protein
MTRVAGWASAAVRAPLGLAAAWEVLVAGR